MKRHSTKRVTACAVVIASLFAVTLVNAGGASAAGVFTCRASAARIQTGVLFNQTIEPTVVQGQPCTDSKTFVGTPLPLSLGGIRVLYSSATVQGTANHPTAYAEVTNVVITALGLPTIQAQVLTSTATAGACGPGGTPVLTSSSKVVGLSIGGKSVTVLDQPVTLNLGVASLYLNRTITTSNSRTQRALDLRTILGVNVVLAESQVGYTGNPCTH